MERIGLHLCGASEKSTQTHTYTLTQTHFHSKGKCKNTYSIHSEASSAKPNTFSGSFSALVLFLSLEICTAKGWGKKLLWYVCDQDKYVFDACGNLFTRIRICCCCWSCLWMLSDSVSASCILSFSFSSSLSASSFSSHVYPVNDAGKTSSLARIKDFQFSIFMRIHTICVRFLFSKCVKRHAYLNHRKSTVCHLKSNASTRMRE